MMNLMTDQWIPVIRKDGTKDRIVPWQIAESDNPVVELTAPRPDFQGALYQFLIGLLQTCFAPEDEDSWLERWEEMPSPDELQKAFGSVEAAFELYNPGGAAFMQENPTSDKHQEEFDKAEWLPVEDLIGGSLSVNTRKGNKDLFVKTKQIEVISPHWAALSLFNVQVTGVLAWGKHRIGLRGNAPLTTIVLPDASQSTTLWKKLWLNVIFQEDMDLIPGDPMKNQISDVFPWMGKTRKSPGKKPPTSPSDGNPLQHYWAMPRRIKLMIELVHCQCDLSGEPIKWGVKSYKRVKNGVYYTNGWVHPLTPYIRSDKNQFPKALVGRDVADGFRQWMSLNFDEYFDEKNKNVRWGRALVVKHFYEEKKHNIHIPTRLWCFGYDADSADVKCWYESMMPTFEVPPTKIDHLKAHVSEALQISCQLAEVLRFSLIRSWFRPQTDSSGKQKWSHVTKSINKAGYLSTYKNIEYEYWEHLEVHFRAIIDELIGLEDMAGKPMSIYKKWVREIQRYCLQYFDQHALNKVIDGSDAKRVIQAKNYLMSELYTNRKSLLKEINAYK